MQSSLNFFSRHAKEYSNSESHIHGKDLDLLMSMLNPDKSVKALDIGTGPGPVAFRMADQVALSVGLDITEHMLDIAAKKGSDIHNIIFVNGDATDLPFPAESFDIVTCRRVAHHIKNKEKLVEEAWRVLKKGGKFGLTDLLKPLGDKLDVFNKLEKVRDSSYLGSESLDYWLKTIKSNAFNVEDFKTFDINETFDSWLSPVRRNSQSGRKARDLIKKNITYFKEVFGYNAELDSFNKTRFIIIANK
jgi:ubiquinone/menaquinone biosynthesis C-methylase UbiE